MHANSRSKLFGAGVAGAVTAITAVTTLTALALLATPQGVAAKSIEMVVPIAPGASTDALSRIAAEELGKRLGEPIVVINKPGGGITLAARYVAEQPADGRTLFMGTAVMSTVPSQKNVPFDVHAFAPIAPVYSTPSVLYVRASIPANTPREFIEWARAQPQGVSFGSSGVGSATHIDAEALAAVAGYKMVHVPYGGSAATIPAMGGDHLDAGFASPSMRSVIQKGTKVKAIMVGSDKPLADWPDLPTVDARLLGNFRAENWAGVFVLAKTPVAIQDKLNAELNAALSQPSVKERFATFSVAPVGGTREAFAKFLETDRTRLGNVIKSRGINLD